MNVGILFAGGVGTRMGHTDKPKQFIEIAKKPIIVHTIEIFENNNNIDAVIVVCVEEWISYMQELVDEYQLKKVATITPGGTTGQMSIFNGIQAAKDIYGEDKETIVLIHDGVRPFIDNDLINNNIENVKKKNSAISCILSTETFVLTDEDMNIKQVPQRAHSLIAKAPQSFYLKDIYNVHLQAQAKGLVDAIDSCTLMNEFKHPLSVVLTDYDNIKITTPKDIVLAESIHARRTANKEK